MLDGPSYRSRDFWIALAELARINRPIGIYLLLWPALWALWLAADGHPSGAHILVFVVGTVLTRSAGCMVNDFADRDFDGFVRRTRDRPLVTGRVTAAQALIAAAVLAGLAGLLLLATNRLTQLLAIPAVALAVLYPFTKRVTHLPQLFLGAAFAWAVPMAFAAERGTLPPESWLVYCATLLWTVAYDTQYAMVDRDDDLVIGVKSIAILFGAADLAMIAVLQGLMLFTLVLVGVRFELGVAYYAGLVAAATLFAHQHWIMRTREREACFLAFVHNRWVGMVVFLGIFADTILS
ncbi:MAG: 4-hydroxybenzoate octaprenyltransferase [Pseudomonadota bacterium]|nr:4-hydroxybenzoate octaprenyltransferase [Pseudomonadota bacterium]